MNKKWIVVPMALPLVAGLGMSLISAARSAGVRQDSPSHSAPAGTSAAEGSCEQRVILAGVEIRCSVCVSAPIQTNQGAVVRPVSVAVSFLGSRVHLGDAHSLRVMPGSSAQAIALDLQGLDLGLADPTLAPSQASRSFHVTATPRTGKTWAQVGNPAADLQVSVTQLP